MSERSAIALRIPGVPEGIREDLQGNRIENHICKMSDSGCDIAAR